MDVLQRYALSQKHSTFYSAFYTYRMAGNIGGKLILRLAIETKTEFFPAKFNIIRWCVGVHVRRDYCYISSSESWETVLFKYFSCDTSAPKQLSSLAQKGKEIVSDFVSKAGKETKRVGTTLYTKSKRNIWTPLIKKTWWFSYATTY